MSTIEYAGDLDDQAQPQPFRVAAPDGLHPDAIAELQQEPSIKFVESKSEDQMPTVRDADGYIIRSTTKPNTAERLQSLINAKIITRIGVGTNNINSVEAARLGQIVIRTPGASTKPVGRRAMTLLDIWASKYHESREKLLAGEWDKKGLEPHDLSQMTLGIIGYGRIGRDVNARSQYDELFARTLFDDIADMPGKTGRRELLEQSDIISLNLDTEEEVIGAEEIELMKDGAVIVNTARGTIVNKEELLRAMNERGFKYLTDVYWEESSKGISDPTVQEIIHHPNFVGTQHTGASDPGTQLKLGREGVRRMIEYATRGRIRGENVASPIFPAINPDDEQERTWPGARLFLAHPSIPGQLRKITTEIGDQGISISDLANREGKKDNGDQLAISVADLPENVSPQQAVEIMHSISGKLKVLRFRIIWLVQKDAEQVTTSSSAEASPEQPDPWKVVDSHHRAPTSLEPVGAL